MCGTTSSMIYSLLQAHLLSVDVIITMIKQREEGKGLFGLYPYQGNSHRGNQVRNYTETIETCCLMTCYP